MVRSDVDVLVIGSGIGGLCSAGLCARAGREVLVLEAHGQPGGAAHGFQRGGYHFESGPSLWSGLGCWPQLTLVLGAERCAQLFGASGVRRPPESKIMNRQRLELLEVTK